MNKDRFICPRSMEGPRLRTGLDYWETNRWKSRLGRWWEWQFNSDRPLGRLVEFLRLRRYKLSGGTTWRLDWQPRTCSYCGGAHPDDVDRLMREGWSMERTGKWYKAYLEPPPGPGSQDREVAPGVFIPSPGWRPVPPVKVYFQHFPAKWSPPRP